MESHTHTKEDYRGDDKEDYKKNFWGAATMLALILCALFIVKFFGELKSYGSIGRTENPVISVSGQGEVQAVPDIATFYFTINKEGKTVKEAQDQVAEVEKSAIDALKEIGVEEKDIQATNVSFNPRYEYQSPSGARLSCNQWGCSPDSGKRVIISYEASESITVKVRDVENTGTIQQALGTLGITNLSGPDFAIDDEEALKAQARREAIANAEEKARALAKDLGVRLGRIASFSESGYPVYFDKSVRLEAAAQDSGAGNAAVLPVGENTIYSDVTIVYEIR